MCCMIHPKRQKTSYFIERRIYFLWLWRLFSFFPCFFLFGTSLYLQIRAKNQLRVNGLGFYLYFGSFYTVLLTMMFILCGALLILAQVSHKPRTFIFFRHATVQKNDGNTGVLFFQVNKDWIWPPIFFLKICEIK